MKKQLILKVSKGEATIEVQVGEHEPSEIGRLVNFRYPDIMLDCLEVFYNQHRDWLSDSEEEDDFKTGSSVATKNPIKTISSHGEKPQPVPATFPSPAKPVPKQRIKFGGWEPIAKTKKLMIYKEVINRILEEYKDGVVPTSETFFNAIREMYGEHLKMSSIAAYASEYKRYIRENKLAVEPSVKEQKTNNLHIGEPIVKPHQKEFKPKIKELLPIEKVVEIWEMLPDDFEYKHVKALVPAHIFQSSSRIDTTNFIIKQFLDNPAFECEETPPGVFKKKIE